MKSNEILKHELTLSKIKIYEYEFCTCNAVTVFIDGYYCIGIKPNLTSSEKFWILSHELEHIKSGATYHVNDDKYIINQAERKANDRMLARSRLVAPIYKAILAGYSKEEICEMYSLPPEIYDCSVEYIKRNLIMQAYNHFLKK